MLKRVLDWFKQQTLSAVYTWILGTAATMLSGFVLWLLGLGWEIIAGTCLFVPGVFGLYFSVQALRLKVEEHLAAADKRASDADKRASAANARADDLMVRTAAYGVDLKDRSPKPKKVAIGYTEPSLRFTAHEIAQVFVKRNWEYTDLRVVSVPTDHLEKGKTMRIEFPTMFLGTPPPIAASIGRLTGHRVQSVDASSLGTDQELKRLDVEMRLTIYGEKPAQNQEKSTKQ